MGNSSGATLLMSNLPSTSAVVPIANAAAVWLLMRRYGRPWVSDALASGEPVGPPEG